MEMKGLKMFKLQESHAIEDLTMAINDNDQQNSAIESHLWSLQRLASHQNLKEKLESKNSYMEMEIEKMITLLQVAWGFFSFNFKISKPTNVVMYFSPCPQFPNVI
jgi:hypothetical protein